MIRVEPTPQLKRLQAFLRQMDERLEWFYYEFGKRLTGMVHEHLLGSLERVRGTESYRKRLVIAEIRDRGARAWWAIAARAKRIGETEHDSSTSILLVIPRYRISERNPTREILVAHGPWTVDTIPYLPSQRQAAVVVRQVGEREVESTRARNRADADQVVKLMRQHDIEFDPRAAVYQRAKIVPDLEVEALRIEFGLAENSGAHWRPAIAFAKRQGIKRLQADKELLRSVTDPTFTGYTSFEDVEFQMTDADVKVLEEFQSQLRRATQ